MNFIQKIFNISTTNNNPLIPFDEVVAKKCGDIYDMDLC